MMYVPTDQMIRVGTVNTRYWTEGEGPPVILIHGLSNCIEDWLLNINRFADQYRVYAPDLIGHGKTDKPQSASYKILDLTRFIIGFMDSLKIQRAHFVGHSFGGAIALSAALNYPSYVDKLVLVSSAGLSQQFPVILRLGSIPGLGELMGFMVLHGSLEKRIRFVRKSWPDPETVPDEMIQLKYNATHWQDIGRTFSKTLRANASFWGMKKSVFRPIIEGLPGLNNPILVVWGDQDDMLPVSQAQIVKNKAPHTRVEIIENSKHDPMIVNPLKFNRLVLDFLSE